MDVYTTLYGSLLNLRSGVCRGIATLAAERHFAEMNLQNCVFTYLYASQYMLYNTEMKRILIKIYLTASTIRQ